MVTQADIAKKLGVSRQLVGLALAGYPKIAAKSRERVMQAAAEMGYVPNPMARALQKKRTSIVAVWVPNQISDYYWRVIREFNQLGKRDQQSVIVSDVGMGDTKAQVIHIPVDALLIVDAPTQAKTYLDMKFTRPAVVVSLGVACEPAADTVEVNLRTGVCETMQHLLDTGYKRIAHVAPEAGITTIREDVYAEYMQKAGLPTEFIQVPDQYRPTARRVMADYVRAKGCPEALFCHNDDIAIGAYRAIYDLGLRVPDNCAVVGCDGLQDTEYLTVPMTTIIQPVEEMCAKAWEFMQQRLQDPLRPPQKVVLKPQLAIRESTRRA